MSTAQSSPDPQHPSHHLADLNPLRANRVDASSRPSASRQTSDLPPAQKSAMATPSTTPTDAHLRSAAARRSEPASVDKHAAALEEELDACVEECVAAANAVQQLPKEDLALLKAALRERAAARKVTPHDRPRGAVDVRDGSDGTGDGGGVNRRVRVPFFIHDLIESVGQMSHWLLIDEPFDDDEATRDRESLANPENREFIEQHEHLCHEAGANALLLVAAHLRKPFSSELLDEYLEQLAEFPTAADLEKSFRHVLMACNIDGTALRKSAMIDGAVAERMAKAAQGGPLEGINDEATVSIIWHADATRQVYLSPLVQLLKHWAFSLGKYFRLLARCRDAASVERRRAAHSRAASMSKAETERAARERERQQAALLDAKQVVRKRSPNFRETAARGEVHDLAEQVSKDEAAATKHDRGTQAPEGDAVPVVNGRELAEAGRRSKGDADDWGDEKERPTIPHREKAAPPLRPSPPQQKPPPTPVVTTTDDGWEEAPTSRRSSPPSMKAAPPPPRSAAASEERPASPFTIQQLEDLRLEMKQLKTLLAGVTQERNDAQRQVSILERATGMNTAAAKGSDSDGDAAREALRAEADNYKTSLEQRDDVIRKLTRERDLIVREKLELRADNKKLEGALRSEAAERTTVQTRLEAALAASRATANAVAGASPDAVRRLERRCADLEKQNQDLVSALRRAEEATEDAVVHITVQHGRRAGAYQEAAARSHGARRAGCGTAAAAPGESGRFHHLDSRWQGREAQNRSLRRHFGDDEDFASPDDGASRSAARLKLKTAPSRSAVAHEQLPSASYSEQEQQQQQQQQSSAPSTWDAGWISRKSTSEERMERLAQRSRDAAVASRLAGEEQRKLRPRSAAYRSISPSEAAVQETSKNNANVAVSGAARNAVQTRRNSDEFKENAHHHHYPQQPTDEAPPPQHQPQPRMFKAVVRTSSASPVASPVTASSSLIIQTQDPSRKLFFKSPAAEDHFAATAGAAAAPADRVARVDGLNPLIRDAVTKTDMTHCNVSPYAAVATDGALDALLEALTAKQQRYLVQLDLSGCSKMTDRFASTTLVEAVRSLPALRHVQLTGTGVSVETQRDRCDNPAAHQRPAGRRCHSRRGGQGRHDDAAARQEFGRRSCLPLV
jgi:hypothetical protein